MTPTCDHKSVGVLVWKSGSLLTIERRKPPFGWALPAGHVDDSPSFESAAIRELWEETGLSTGEIREVFDARKPNPCRRVGGTWHHWKLFAVRAFGRIRPEPLEVKRIAWRSPNDLLLLRTMTRRYLRGTTSERVWALEPGLEPVWYEMLEELDPLLADWSQAWESTEVVD